MLAQKVCREPVPKLDVASGRRRSGPGKALKQRRPNGRVQKMEEGGFGSLSGCPRAARLVRTTIDARFAKGESRRHDQIADPGHTPLRFEPAKQEPGGVSRVVSGVSQSAQEDRLAPSRAPRIDCSMARVFQNRRRF